MTQATLVPEPDSDADARFRNWMRLNLARAAGQFGLSVTGVPVFGWRLRSIGAIAHGPNGACWLRVVSEQPQWATGDFWTGNQDANALTGLPKPVVLASTEWDEAGWRFQRAEVMTLLPGEPCSPSDVARTEIELRPSKGGGHPGAGNRAQWGTAPCCGYRQHQPTTTESQPLITHPG
ncbi:MAG: hypothetical protein ACT4NY_31120 [Pseudonocardiales bacterium]